MSAYVLYPAVECPAPDDGFGTVPQVFSVVYRVGNTVDYQCNNENYTSVIQGNLTIECQSNGQWSDSPPVCGEYSAQRMV